MAQKKQKSSPDSKTFPKLIIASTEESADLLYAGGFNAPDEFLYYETDREKCIVVSPLEYARAVSEANPGVKVTERSRFVNKKNPAESITVNLSRALGIGHWLVPARFPLLEAEKRGAAEQRHQRDQRADPEEKLLAPQRAGSVAGIVHVRHSVEGGSHLPAKTSLAAATTSRTSSGVISGKSGSEQMWSPLKSVLGSVPGAIR